MATAAQLAIDIVADSSRAESAFDQTAAGAKQMADQVEQSGRTTARSLDGIASSADDMGGKAGKATGALGALSSGAELAGPGFAKYGTALQSAALATDFVSGVSDSFNLILESTIVKSIRSRVVTIAKTVAEKSAAAATKAMAVAQRALNLAMAANPVGLIVAALVLLVAGLVLAYKKSETFRAIVDKVGEIGKRVFGFYVDYIQKVIDIAGKLVGWFKDRIPGALETLGDVVKRIGDVLLAPFRVLKGLIDDIIDLIQKIKVPDWVPGFRGIAPTGTAAGVTPGFGTALTVNVSVPGGFIGDEDLLASRVGKAVSRALAQVGVR